MRRGWLPRPCPLAELSPNGRKYPGARSSSGSPFATMRRRLALRRSLPPTLASDVARAS
jgi:hypothetical protein